MNDVAAEPVEQDHVEAPVEAPEAEEVTIDPEEEKALSRGWKPKDVWVESGKNPDHHTNAKAFNMIRDAHEKNAEFKTIIEQVDPLWLIDLADPTQPQITNSIFAKGATGINCLNNVIVVFFIILVNEVFDKLNVRVIAPS